MFFKWIEEVFCHALAIVCIIGVYACGSALFRELGSDQLILWEVKTLIGVIILCFIWNTIKVLTSWRKRPRKKSAL